MPIWSEILNEIHATASADSPPAFDQIRRKYLARVREHTGRNTILYATSWTQTNQPGMPPDLVSMTDEDLHGLMEVVYGLQGPDLDLIIHSPGGSINAAEALVAYIRTKFVNVRVIVPQLAKSAATMVACSADRIVMGKHSFLGPIDPQLLLSTPLGRRMVPAQAIIQQFEQAQRECTDRSKLPSWLPMLSQYGPDLLVQCQHVSALSVDLVRGWLQSYMFRDAPNAEDKAREIATWLSTHSNFMNHGRHISREDLAAKGLTIDKLEQDPEEQDLFLSVFHATAHTFASTPAVKLIENHTGRSFIKQFQSVPGGPRRTVPPT